MVLPEVKNYNKNCKRRTGFHKGGINSVKKNKGQGMVEYVLVISFIALALVFALGELGTGLLEFFNSVAGQMASLGS